MIKIQFESMNFKELVFSYGISEWILDKLLKEISGKLGRIYFNLKHCSLGGSCHITSRLVNPPAAVVAHMTAYGNIMDLNP